MQFTLYYRGELKSKAKPDAKHTLRRYFHCQMKQVWQQMPLKDFDWLLQPAQASQNLSILQQTKSFTFAPLVSDKVFLVAELDIQLLWPQDRGKIITSGGDIDNRLKTLLDALKVPSEDTALPQEATPGEDENPFFCLLQDDSLITRLSVEADRLLEPVSSPSEVVLFIRVTTKQLKVTFETVGLA